MILTENQLPFYFQKPSTQYRKNDVSEMIESKIPCNNQLPKRKTFIFEYRKKIYPIIEYIYFSYS